MAQTNNTNSKELAVIMSVYYGDCYKYVQMAIDSLLSQTYSSFDLYICIDGTLDEPLLTYVNSLTSDNVFIYKNNENIGLAKSMNLLLNKILPQQNYQFVARMDADDINASTRFEKQIKYFHSNEEIDCLGTWAIEIDAQGNEFYKKSMPCSHEDCFNFFSKRDCMIHPTVMFRKSYFEKAGLYPEDTYFGEDTMMWAQGFANNCHFANIPEFLYFFRLNDVFFDRRRGIKHAKSIWRLRRKVNKMLHYGLSADIWAILYALAKLMPKRILNIIYKTLR